MSDNITFIGVGAIGLPVAARIAEAGHRVTGVDPRPEAAERAAGTRIESMVTNMSEVDELATVVVMVATPTQLTGLVDDALERDLNGSGWIIMSTVGPDSVRTEADRLQAAGAMVIDSPVFGDIPGTGTGSLTLFTSGALSDIEALGDVLDAVGPRNVVGERIGEGQAFKLVNQHLCAIHIAAAAEALNLADRMGLDPEKALRAVENGGAGSRMLSDRGPRMLALGQIEVHNSIGIFVKDAGMVVHTGHRCRAQVPLAEAANQRYRLAADMDLLTEDDSQVIRTYR